MRVTFTVNRESLDLTDKNSQESNVWKFSHHVNSVKNAFFFVPSIVQNTNIRLAIRSPQEKKTVNINYIYESTS